MNYEIEKTLAKYGGEADKGIERTCGNCICYDAEAFRCCNASIDDETGFYKKTDKGCWWHMTEAEKQRLESLVKAFCDRQRMSRIDEERKQGTGQCKDCPYKRMVLMTKECPYANGLDDEGGTDMTDPRATTRLTDGLVSAQVMSAYKISSDINELSPVIGELIHCDCFGDGHYKSCILESWTKRTFKASYNRHGAKITMTIAFNGKGQHCFWRSLTSILNYQFTRDEE